MSCICLTPKNACDPMSVIESIFPHCNCNDEVADGMEALPFAPLQGVIDKMGWWSRILIALAGLYPKYWKCGNERRDSSRCPLGNLDDLKNLSKGVLKWKWNSNAMASW